uniref:C2 domain-containing protein n=1 Tax=Rhabditophanes sp. KR3021 TaxID=114890 RepID=A0AC35TMX4_9BILA
MYGGLSDIASKTRDESLRHGKKLPPLNLSFKKAENALSPENTELSTTRTNFTNKDDVEEGQETPMSPGSQSQVSKRTQSSLEMTTTIRQNIRSRAKASLQTKRGSVQLEKRILRSKLALLSTKKKEVAPYDPDEADDKIEKAISIGNQYTMQKQNLEAPVDHQRSFFVDNYEVPLIGDDSVVTSFYQKAYNIIMFSPILKQILTYYKEGTNYGIEDGASIFKSTEKDYTKLIKRSGICFMNNGSELIGSKQETFYTTDVKSYEHVDYEESTLVEYVYRENKGEDEGSDNESQKKKAEFKEYLSKCEWQLQIDFNNVFVTRSAIVQMDENFEVPINEEYNLSVHDEAESIHVILYERYEKGVYQMIAKVGITLDEDESGEGVDGKFTFGSEAKFKSFNNFIGAGGDTLYNLNGCLITHLKGYGKEALNDYARKFSLKHADSTVQETFSLIPPESRLIGDEEFDEDIRFNALHARYENRKMPGRHEKSIPLYCEEMDNKFIFLDEPSSADLGVYSFGIEGFKKAARQMAITLRSDTLQMNGSTIDSIKKYNDIIREETFPNLFSGFGALFGTKDISRKLKPMRKDVDRIITTSITQFKILINVQSASNLPSVIDDTILHPFVEITFQGKSIRTNLSEGTNPLWQQTISFDFDGSQLGNSALNSVTDKFTFTIFNQVFSTMKHDDREVNTIHKQIDLHYLSKVEVPFSTIYIKGKIDGNLLLENSIFTKGYSSKGHSFLKVSMSTDPMIAAPLPDQSMLNLSTEEEEVVLKAMDWRNKCLVQHGDRRYKALVLNNNGRSVLVCRYLRPVKPPIILEQFCSDKLKFLKQAVQLVKNIPSIVDPIMFPGTCDLWTAIDQTIAIAYGSEEEKAIMLCCWLLYHKYDASIILCDSLPEGSNGAYVLVDTSLHLSLVNTQTGTIWKTTDTFCPIINIGTIITENNVYGNIQKTNSLSGMSFELNKIDLWKPLFEKYVPEFTGVQNETPNYNKISDEVLLELKTSLEREIKAEIDKSRQYGIPQWNILVSRTLRDILAEESILFNNKEIERIIQDQFKTYFKINSVIISIPFYSREAVIEHILNLKLHINSDPKVQFAISVNVVPFVNNIVNCRIALAYVIPL